jgi:hypothetical protein
MLTDLIFVAFVSGERAEWRYLSKEAFPDLFKNTFSFEA